MEAEQRKFVLLKKELGALVLSASGRGVEYTMRDLMRDYKLLFSFCSKISQLNNSVFFFCQGRIM